MSTRACYRFVDPQGREATVYIHHDGDPAYAWNYFAQTLQSGLAWPLPRFEAHEFAAAFVAANKTRAGGVLLTDKWNLHSDLAYLYKLTINNRVLILKCEEVSSPEHGPLKPSRWSKATVYHGPLHRLIFAKGQLTATRGWGLKIEKVNQILQEPTSPDRLGPMLAQVTARLEANSDLVTAAYSVLAGAGLTRAGL